MDFKDEAIKIIERIDDDYEDLTLEEFRDLLVELISELKVKLESVEEAFDS